jgi:ABC-2 type transport system ATP-binding protein
MNVIEVQNLVKVYKGGTRALKGASLSVAPGERVCLLGPNGAGKSTLIRILSGILRPTEGSATVLGFDSRADDFKTAKRRIGIVPEGPGVYDDITVRTYLQFVRRLYDRGSVDEIIEMFDLGQYANMTMNKLSGGFQRRVVLAAAFLPDPDLLLLDEPTVRLDPIASVQIHDYIKRLSADKTFLLCTHNLAEAEELADKVIIIRDGHVLVQDSIEHLRSRFSRFVSLRSIEPQAKVAGIVSGMGFEPVTTDGVVRVPVTDYREQVPRMLEALLTSGVHVYSAQLEEPSLEEMFLTLVGGEE